MLEGVWKWARRHPLAMGTAAVIACALLVLTAVTSVYNARLSTAIVRADREAGVQPATTLLGQHSTGPAGTFARQRTANTEPLECLRVLCPVNRT